MAFDSLAPDFLAWTATAALFASAVAAWWLAAPLMASARLYLRFAAVLLAALAAAGAFGLTAVAALLLLPLAVTALALSALARFARPLHGFAATVLLVASLAAGLCAMLSSWWIAALIPVAVGGLVIVAAALHATAPLAALSGLALFASAPVYLEEGARAGMLLFVAAALLGLSRSPVARNQLVRSINRERRGAAVP